MNNNMMSIIKLKSHLVSEIKEHLFIIESDGGTLYYTEWWTPSGRVIDSTLRDSQGNSVNDWRLKDQIEELIFGQEP